MAKNENRKVPSPDDVSIQTVMLLAALTFLMVGELERN